MIKYKEFAARLEEAKESLVESTMRMNEWLSNNENCRVINVETIYGRYGTRFAHYDGEKIGVVGVRLWYSIDQAT